MPAAPAHVDRTRPHAMVGYALAAALVALFVHAPSLHNSFTNWDDTAYITMNPLVKSPAGLRRIWLSRESPQYYPLTFTTFWIEYRLWGRQPFGYHAVNVALHAINAGLVALVVTGVLALTGTSPGLIPLAVALLFAVSPAQVMSVAWVAERKNVLSTCFGLLAMIGWMRWLRLGATRAYAWSLMAFVACLLSKSAWAVLPIVLIAMAVRFRGAAWLRTIRAATPFLVVAAGAAFVTIMFEGQFDQRGIPPLGERLLMAPGALLFYAGRCIVPAWLYPFYPTWEASPSHVIAWIPLLTVVACVAGIVLLRQRLHPAIPWGLFTFVILVAPILGVVSYENLSATWVSDHFVYYACIWLYLAAVILFAGHGSRRSAPRARAGGMTILRGAGLIGVLAIMAVVTRRTIPTWSDDLSLWRRALEAVPDSALAHSSYGAAYVQHGDLASAVREFRRAVELDPGGGELRNRLGGALIEQGRLDEAETELKAALMSNPGLAEAHLNLGIVAQKRGRLDEALEHYRAAVEIDPAFDQAVAAVVDVLLQTGRGAAAQAALEKGLGLRPHSALLLRQMAAMCEMNNRPDEAEALYRQSVKMDPESAESWFGLGVAASHHGDWDEAAAFYGRALSLQPNQSRYWTNLGHVLLRKGELEGASEALTKATMLDPTSAPAWNNLAMTALAQGDKARAIECFSRAARLEPRQVLTHLRLAATLGDAGREADAVAALGDALRLIRGPVSIPLRAMQVRILAEARDPQVRDTARAIELAESLQKDFDESAEAWDALASALASDGRLSESAAAAEQGILRLEAQAPSEVTETLRRRLERYRRLVPASASAPATGRS